MPVTGSHVNIPASVCDCRRTLSNSLIRWRFKFCATIFPPWQLHSQCDTSWYCLFFQVFFFLASTGAPFRSQGDLWPALLLHGHHYCPQPHLWCNHRYICWPEEWEAEERGNPEDNMFYLWWGIFNVVLRGDITKWVLFSTHFVIPFL